MKIVGVDYMVNANFALHRVDESYLYKRSIKQCKKVIVCDSYEEGLEILHLIKNIESQEILDVDSVYFLESSFPSLLISRVGTCPIKRKSSIVHATKIVTDLDRMDWTNMFIGITNGNIIYQHCTQFFESDEAREKELKRIKANNNCEWNWCILVNDIAVAAIENQDSIVSTRRFVKKFLDYLPKPSEEEVDQIKNLLGSKDPTAVSMGLEMCKMYDIRNHLWELLPIFDKCTDSNQLTSAKYFRYLCLSSFIKSADNLEKICEVLDDESTKRFKENVKCDLITRIKGVYKYELKFLGMEPELHDKNRETNRSTEELATS